MSDVSAMKVECPVCETPYLASDLVQAIEFPDEAERVLELVEGRLNVLVCRVCENEVSLQPVTGVVNNETGAAATSGISPEALKETLAAAAAAEGVEAPEQELASCRDYAELREVVLGWLNDYLMAATTLLFSGGQRWRPLDGVAPYQQKLVLLALKAQVDGSIPPGIRTEPPLPVERQHELIGEILAALVSDYVRETYTYAFHNGGISRLLDLLAERIPPTCLTEQALDNLREHCTHVPGNIYEDPMALDAPFRAEYLHAAAHAHCGLPNPRTDAWAQFALLLFYLSRQPNVVVPEAMLLTTDVLSRTIPFDVAWDVAIRELSEAGDERREFLDHVDAWFEHIGYADRFADEWAAAPLDLSLADEADDAKMVEAVVAALEAGPPATDRARGTATVMFLRALLRAGRIAVARDVAEWALDDAADSAPVEVLGWLAVDVAAAFKDFMQYADSGALLARQLEKIDALDPPCVLRFAVLNEVGNVHRYRHELDEALEAYDLAGRLAEICEEVTDEHRVRLRRNRAIVFRELGRFEEAVRLFESCLESVRKRGSVELADLYVSLARTYFEANLAEEALPYAELACAIPLSNAHVVHKVHARLAASAARAKARPGSPLPELEEAIQLSERLPGMKVLLAGVTLYLGRVCPVPEELRSRGRELVRAELETRRPDELDDSFVTAATLLAQDYFDGGDEPKARAVVDRLEQLDAEAERGLPWPISHIRARLLEGEDEAESWRLMRSVLDALDARVPDEGGPAFTFAWMSDKEDFQRDLVRSAKRAVAAGVAQPVEYLDVFEFTTAREIRDAPEEKSRWAMFDEIAESAVGRKGAALIAFLEDESDLLAIALHTRSTDCRVAGRLPTRTFREAAALFAGRIGAGCVLPAHFEAAEEALREPLALLGALLAQEAEPSEQICVVPSPALLGLPLHAATTPDGSQLLERNPINVAPNLTVLHAALLGAPRGERSGLCVVSKVTDAEAFVARANAVGDRIAELSRPRLAYHLRELEATKERGETALSDVDEFLFVCHGARSTPLEGRGICVSDGTFRPPALLPLQEAPELARFVLAAGDLDRLPRTPALVVSIACSSGRATAGAGGTRIGLERALFAKGTRTILAPLWDVDQQSALEFVERFYELRTENPHATLGEHHQAACLEARRRHPELYHWAPFALNGSWN